jgi:hypothetical protein
LTTRGAARYALHATPIAEMVIWLLMSGAASSFLLATLLRPRRHRRLSGQGAMVMSEES